MAKYRKSNPQLLYNLTTPKPLEEVKDRHDPDVIPKGRPVAKVDAVTSRFTLAKGIPDPMKPTVEAFIPAC